MSEASERRGRAIIDTATDAFVAIDDRGRVTDWNAAAEATFGWRREEIVGRLLADTIVEPSARLAHAAGLKRFLATGEGRLVGRRTEMVAVRRDGRELDVELAVSAIPAGDSFEFVAFIHDISNRRQAEEALREAEERFRQAFDFAPIGMSLTSLDGVFLRVNRALGEMLGRSIEELAGTRVADVTHPEDRDADAVAMNRLASGQQANYRAEKRYVHADGYWVWASLSASIVNDPHGRPWYFVSQMEDITQRKNAEDQLSYLADHDPLTGLYNLRRFRSELDRGVAHSRRYGRPLVVLVIDLDNFKTVNDTLGHAAGDEVLRRTAQLLEARLRRTDVLGRLGGDEFAAILPETDHDMAQIVAGDLLANIHVITLGDRQPFGWLSASVGIAGAPDHRNGDANGDRLLADADAAMYEAKRAGRDRYAIALRD